MSKESQPLYCSTKYCKRIANHGKHCKTCVNKKWRESHPYENTFNNLKQNATRRGVKFTITLEYWKQWCDKNDYLRLRGMGGDDMTVDRKKAWLGYEPGNLHKEAGNRAKNLSRAQKSGFGCLVC
jgi:hypothetical protein